MKKLNFNPKLVADVVYFCGASVSMYFLASRLLKRVGNRGSDEMNKEMARKAGSVIAKLKSKYPGLTNLTEYELIIIGSLIMPDEINISFNDIGGVDQIIEELHEDILFPLTEPALYDNHTSLLQAPKGVLLYGPPGCGKTMLAKALARESSANFINIKMSTIMDKWFGESNKLVAAIFSLAQRLEPCIVFIDEIDSFLRQRSSSDHETTASLKAEFMTLWDGLTSGGRVLVLGATNRPNDIDEAILRRMPKRFAVCLPNAEQRRKILQVTLRDTKLEAGFDYDDLVMRSPGLSGSDLKEICRNAAQKAAREYIRANFVNGKRISKDEMNNGDKATKGNIAMRPLRNSDFFASDGNSGDILPRNNVSEAIFNSLD
ncbi:MSP1 putative membrane-spanning ATPase [Nadsonia fulvescens var. elongata DSM 6958]|uniref:MSP1 putative membrane-spanning ATPase n=1 Tax=Nadsonia fulvescens var. elongata DSM 6958 TaxID=857566 RepID=A0A1E3PKK1_9ASCO|nr:MSP1 putative membrane-spanning ATPase [Nadsonia fulvescens var. elongata DSM 6958]